MDLRAEFALHLLAALGAGAGIGLERSIHGRPAGFRTHALVCMAGCLLMLLAVHEADWFPRAGDSVRVDPTRMAQGIMTGIGFLGAGVIFKEGLSVRGLTTAASIWITSAIGVVMGAGLFVEGALAALATLGVLSGFRWIEEAVPAQQYAHHRVRFDREDVLAEPALLELLRGQGFDVFGVSYRLTDEGKRFEYRMTIRTSDARNYARLAQALSGLTQVREFHISPAGA
ncbi:MAG: MgtC/SapB family protein [Anaeromyxobacteraceae bacterium]